MKGPTCFIFLCVILISSQYHSNLSANYDNSSKANTIPSNSVNKKTVSSTNYQNENKLLAPESFVSVSKGFLSNSKSEDIIEIHKYNLYIRFSTNYSIFKTFSSKYETLKYYPLQNQSKNYGLILDYNSNDVIYETGNQPENRTYGISIINDKGIKIASNTIVDERDGQNTIGGILFGEFDSLNPGPEILVSYIEIYKDPIFLEEAITRMMLFSFSDLKLLSDKSINTAISINDGFYYNYSQHSGVIPCIETNMSSSLSRINIYSSYSFSNILYQSNWAPLDSIKLKIINNYEANSYLLMKLKTNYNYTISLIKFQVNFTKEISTFSQKYNLKAVNSNIIIRKSSNNTLSYLIQTNTTNIWKQFDNTTLAVETISPTSTWIYKGLIDFNNDNVSDLFIISYSYDQITNFIIQDGTNSSQILSNVSFTGYQTAEFGTDILVGRFSQIGNENSTSLEQILFIYDNYYFQLLNDGKFDNLSVVLFSTSGSFINFCSNVAVTLEWLTSSKTNSTTFVYADNNTYILKQDHFLTSDAHYSDLFFE